MKSTKQIVACFLSIAIAAGAGMAGTNIAMADTTTNTFTVSTLQGDQAATLNQKRTALLQHAGFTTDELNALSSSDVDILYRALLARQQGLTDSKVGVTAVAKAVLRVWKALPAGIRHKIEGYTTLNGFLKAIDHFTGTEEQIIRNACKYVGMNDFWADTVTKTITLFI